MQTHTIQRATKRITSKQVGRGGRRGKTSGRGTKGQNARSGHKNRPALRDAIKKLPKLRGYAFNSHVQKAVAVNLAQLEIFCSAGDTVTREYLVEKKVVEREMGKIPTIKILGTGTLTKKINVEGLAVSAKAKETIETLGGSVKL